MKQYPSFGSSHIDQPNDCGEMTDREIEVQRIQILESDKLAESVESWLENRQEHNDGSGNPTFTRSELGIISYYIGMGNKDGLFRYMKDLLGKPIESIVRKVEE